MMNDENPSPVEPSGALLQALIRILSPLVRLMVRHQITYPFLSQLLKSIYLQQAMDLSTDKKELTDSRLSLVTGVHRKDVRRLRQEKETIALPESKPASIAAQVISIWLSEYLDENGMPKPVYKTAAKGSPNFEKLVNDISRQDIRARSLLDEWVEKGIVRIDSEDLVHLNKEAFVPSDNFDDKAYFFGHHIHDHISACVENILSEKPRFFERGVYFNNLTPESVAELKEYIDAEAMDLLKRVNSKARELQIQDRGKSLNQLRFRYGAYFYSDKNSSIEPRKKKTPPPASPTADSGNQ